MQVPAFYVKMSHTAEETKALRCSFIHVFNEQ